LILWKDQHRLLSRYGYSYKNNKIATQLQATTLINRRGYFYFYSILLHQEPQNISIRLGLFDQTSPQMIGTSPFAKVPNGLGMQGNGLGPVLVETLTTQDGNRTVDGGGKYSEFGALAAHVELGFGRAGGRGSVVLGLWPLRSDKGGSAADSGESGKGCGGAEEEGEEESSDGLHDWCRCETAKLQQQMTCWLCEICRRGMY